MYPFPIRENKPMIKPELLAPAGSFSKLKTALYFGADAVYVGGKNFSLRAMADNFDDNEMKEAVEYTHALGKKIYVTVNIIAKNFDLDDAEKYFKFLDSVKVDAVIISDVGLISLCRKVAPTLPVHVSTQANITNKYSAEFFKNMGVTRVILARELSLKEINEIHEYLPDMEIETFVHGAMCISYSGRCLLSDYFTGRQSNRGACVQACRWNYEIREINSDGEFYPIEEDGRGTYLLNSKDLNMISHMYEMANSGIVSFKIEGRMKSEYYLATVINAYRRAIDAMMKEGEKYSENLLYSEEVLKTAHRVFTTAYMLGKNDETVNYEDSQSAGNRTFIAIVTGYDAEKKLAKVEMRNRFKKGETLEVLSPYDAFNKLITLDKIYTEEGEEIDDVKHVQQSVFIETELPLREGDMLRK